MAHVEKRLTALGVQRLTQPGRHADGGGLYLEIDPSGGKRWLLRLQSNGRRRDFGLGGLRKVSLAEARDAADQYRRQIRQGIDPVAHRRAQASFPSIPTFREAAEKYHTENLPTWRNAKHGAQVINTLETYAYPGLGSMPVDQIREPHIRSAIISIWLDKQETAKRVRQRITAVMDWARANGHCDVVLDLRAKALQLPKQSSTVKHHKALGYRELPQFLASLEAYDGVSDTVRAALVFTILTAARSGEVRGARWEEFDIPGKVWAIPATRMKAGKEHRIPLAKPALAILVSMQDKRSNATRLVFPGTNRRDRPLSDMALTMFLRRLGASITVHGFRSTFRDWVAEQTNYPREIAEAALAHQLADKVEHAYARTDYFDRRAALMDDWAKHCSQEPPQ
jgi:integrase